MKTALIFTLLFISLGSFAQSFQKSEIYGLVNNQEQASVSSIARQKGFMLIKNVGTLTLYGKQYEAKANDYNTETIMFGEINGLYAIIYKPKKASFESYKSLFLDSSFKYAYSFEDVPYYENSQYRLGIDSTKGTISIFTNSKQQ